MHTGATTVVSKPMLWAGRIISALVGLFMLFDSIIKLMPTTAAVEGTVRLGYPLTTIVPIGLAAFVSIAIYLIPRTSILGEFLLTGYLGGAIATMVRVQSAWFVFPLVLGALAWLGLYLKGYAGARHSSATSSGELLTSPLRDVSTHGCNS